MLSKKELRQREGLVGGVEAAALLGTTEDSFRAMRRRGTFDVDPVDPAESLAASVSSRPLWRREDVLGWLEGRRVRAHFQGDRW